MTEFGVILLFLVQSKGQIFIPTVCHATAPVLVAQYCRFVS